MSRLKVLLACLCLSFSTLAQTPDNNSLPTTSKKIAGFNSTYQFPGNAQVTIPNANPSKLNAAFSLNSASNITKASFVVSDTSVVEYTYGQYSLEIHSMSYDASGDHLLCSGIIEMPTAFQEDTNKVLLKFSNLKLDSKGIKDLGNVHMSRPIQYHGFYYGLGLNHNIYKDSLVLDGYVVMPHNIGQLHTSMKVLPNGTAELELDSIRGNALLAYGYEFDVISATHKKGVWTFSSDLIIPDGFGKIKANGLKVDTSGVLQAPTFDLTNASDLTMGVYKAKPKAAWMLNNKLMMKADFYLWNEIITLDSLSILSSGDLDCKYVSIPSQSATIAGFAMDSLNFEFGYFVIDSLANQKYGFQLNGRANLPNNWGNVRVSNSRIYLDGTFDGGVISDKDSIDLNGFKFHLSGGDFYPSIHYYELSGSITSHSDTSIAQILVDGDVVGYTPIINGSWTLTGVHFPQLEAAHVKVINIIDTDNDGEYNPTKDAIFDISQSVRITKKSGALGHFKGASNRPNGELIKLKSGSTNIGTAVVWDGHWEYFAFGLTSSITQANTKVTSSRRSDGYQISGTGLNNVMMVDIEYKGKSQGKILVEDDNSFASPVFQIHNFQSSDITVYAYKDGNGDGIIQPNSDIKTNITSQVKITNDGLAYYKIFGKSSKPNGAVVAVSVKGSQVGKALVWEGHWRYDFKTNESLKVSQISAKVYNDLKLDSLLEDVSTTLKAQAILLSSEDFSQWMEYHVIATDSVGVNNATLLMDGEIALPNFGKVPVKGMNISPTGVRMPGKKSSHGNPHFRFDGYNYGLNSLDITISDPSATLDGEIILPDNAGRLWAKVNAGKSGVTLENLELEQKEIAIGNFVMHVDDLKLNAKGEMVLKGELDIPNMDKYLQVDKLTISAKTERKVADINTQSLSLKTNGYSLAVNEAYFMVDTLPGGAFVDTMSLSGIIDLGAYGNLNANDLLYDSYGNILSGKLSVGSKGLKVNGFDFSTGIDSLRFVHNELHMSKITYAVPGKNANIVFEHILLDKDLNFEVDQIKLDATSYDYQGYTLTVDNMAWKNNQLLIGGILSLGGDLGNVEIDNIVMNPDGSLSGGQFNIAKAAMSYHGFQLDLDTIILDQQGVLSMAGEIVLPDSLGKLKLDGVQVNAQKVLSYGQIEFSGANINWLGFNASIDSLEFIAPYFHITGEIATQQLGNIKLSGLKLDANGTFTGGSLQLPPNANATYNGYGISLDDIEVDSDGIELSGSITLPDSLGTVKVSDLQLDGKGGFEEGHFLFEKGSKAMSFNGLQVDVNSIDLANNKLSISAALELPKNVGTIGAKFSLVANQGLELDSLSIRNANITYSGFQIDLESCAYTNNNFVINGSIEVPTVGKFNVSQLSLSSAGDFNGGTVAYAGGTWNWGSLAVQINTASIVDHEILLDADVALPNNMGTLGLKNVDIDLNGKIINASVTLDSIGYAGYKFHLDSASISNNNLISLAGYVRLPNNYGKVSIDNFGIKTTGEIIGGDASYEGQGFSLGQLNLLVEHVHLNNTSVALDGKINFPSSIGGSLDFKGLGFDTGGKIAIDSIGANNLSINVKGFGAKLDQVSWDKQNEQITIDGSLSLSQSFGDAKFTDINIGLDGSFSGGTFDLSGLNMNYHGVALKPTLFQFDGESITASCSLTLPNEANLSVANMKIDASGISDFGQISANNVSFKWKGYDFELTQLEFSNDLFSFSGNMDFGSYGSLAATDIQISSAGEFYGGTFVPTGAQLKFASMALTLDSLVFQQNEFEFTGSLALPDNNGTIKFNEVDITTDGKFEGGYLVYEGNGFSFKNGEYSVIPSDISLGDNSLTLDARVIENSTDSVKAIMTGTTITGDPFNIQFGTETLLDTEFYYKGFDVKVDTFTVAGTDITYTGHITIPKLGKLDVDHLIMNVSTGKIEDHGNITYTGQTWTLGSTSFTIDSVKLEEDYIELKAKMQLPNNAGEVDLTDMKVSTSGNLLSAEVDVQGISMGYNGYTVALSSAKIEGEELELDGTINLSTFGTFTVSDLEFDLSAGTFDQGTISSDNAEFTLGSFTAVPQTIAFIDNKIDIDGYLKLPKIFGDSASVTIDSLAIGTDGSFSIASVKSNNVEVTYKGFDLAFTELAWTDGLVISADLTLPGNSQPISVKDLKVAQDGSVTGGSIEASGVSIAYHGFSLTLDEAEFLPGDGAKMSGTFAVEQAKASLSVTDLEFGSQGITHFGSVAMKSSSSIKWHSFDVSVSSVSVDSSGTVLVDGGISLQDVGSLTVKELGFTSAGNFIPGDITLENQTSLSFGDYSATISTLAFSNDVISVDGSIGLSGNRTVSIAGMSIDFDGNFDGGKLTYSGDPITFQGSKITPYDIGFENKVLSASASMVLPDDLATVTVTDLTIDKDFNVTVGKIEVAGVSIHYKGIIVNLDSAVYNNSDLALWGNIQNDKLGNLKVTGLTMNTQGVITGGAVDYSGTQTFGSLEVDITDLGFDWGQGDITISGSLQLPSNIGTLVVDTIVLDPHSGALKSGTLSATSPVNYGGVGIESISATIDDSKIELSGTASLPDNVGTISVDGLDINLNSGDISGGTFTFHEQTPIKFGGASVSITSLTFNLTEVDLSAQIQLPSNLGQAGVNDAKFSNGKFTLGSVSFSGQSISIKGVSCSITKGLITSDAVTVSVDVSLSDAAEFAIDDFSYDYASGDFSGGTFNLEKAEIKYKDFDLIILQTTNQTDKAKFSAKFSIPDSDGYATINNIYISLEDGVDFSQMDIDYGSLPNLLPTGFKMTVKEFEAINNGILFSGSIEILGSSADVEGLKVTTSGIDIDGLTFHTPSFKLGSYSMPNLDFAFSKSDDVWEIDISGKADIPDVGALDFSGYVKSDGDFGGEFVLKGASIPLGESGFALYNPGGGIYDSSGVFTVKMQGDFAPEGMNYVYVLHGELSVNSLGVIQGSTEGKLFNMITLQRSYCSIDLAKGKLVYDTEFSYGIQTPPKTTVIKKVDAVTQKIPTIELMGYGGGVNVSTWTGIDISGSGNCTLIGIEMGTISLDINDKHFEFYADFHVPNPAGGPNLIEVTGNVDIDYDEGAGDLSGSASVLGHDLVAMDFNFSPDQMAGSASINMAIAQFNVDFQATKNDKGHYALDYFHGDAWIGYESMTFADMTLDITADDWSGSAHAWVPGFGSEIDITIKGNSSGITYFDGKEAFRIFNIQLEEAEFTYQKVNNVKQIKFDAHGSLPHFGRSSFNVSLTESSSHWILNTLHGEVDAYIDINLPVFGHWHKELGSATIDYSRSQGKLTVDLHSTLFNVGIVRVTDLYGIVYFHEPSAVVGVKGHYGLGKHTYHLWKLHCHYHFCCHGGCSWEKCCYWTVNLGDKDFDVSVKVKGPSLPKPKKAVPIPPKPDVIVENCDVDHIHSAQVCTGTKYSNVTFNNKPLDKVQFQSASFTNSTFKKSIVTNAFFDKATVNKLYFNNTDLTKSTFSNITNGKTMSFTNNSNLDEVKFMTNTLSSMKIQGLDATGLSFASTTLSSPNWQNLNLESPSFSQLTVTSGTMKHLMLEHADIENSDFSNNTFTQVTIKGTSVLKGVKMNDIVFNSCNIDSASIDANTTFAGSHFSQSVMQNLDLSGNTNLTNMIVDNNSSFVNVNLGSADITGSSFNGVTFGKVSFDKTTANNVHFTNVNLAGSDLNQTDMEGAVFSSVQAHKSSFTGVNFHGVLFTNSDLSLSQVDKNTKFTKSVFSNTNLHGVDFSNNANMDSLFVWGSCDLHGVKFENTNLAHTVFFGVKFHKTDFKEADLSNATFIFCEFDTVNFQEANLSGTHFYWSSFKGHTDFHASQMVGTNLTQIGNNFENTNLAGVNFTNANLTGVDFGGSTVDFCNFTGSNLTNVNLKGSFSRPQTMLQFDGADDYVKVPMNSNPLLDYNATAKTSYSANLSGNTCIEIMLDEPETEITHEFWFKTSQNNGGLFSVEDFKEEVSDGHDRHIYLSGGNIYARVWNNEIIHSNGKNYADGNWHHVAHVVGPSVPGQRLYVDGDLVASGAKFASAFNWQDRVYIGFSVDAQQDYFNGLIDEVRIWRKALTQNEIKNWKDKPVNMSHPAYASLIAYLPFDKGSGSVAVNTAFPGIVSNWHKRSAAHSMNPMEPKSFHYGPSLEFNKEITIETWARSLTSTWNDDAVLVNRREGFFLHPVKNTSDIHFWYRNKNNKNHNVGSFTATNISTGYHHYAVTFGNGKVKMYEDGTLQKTFNVNKDVLFTDKTNLNLGIDEYGSRKALKGNMINTRIWDKALSATELNASKDKFIVTPLDPNFENLKLQVKDLAWDNATYAFNGYFMKNWDIVDGSWSSTNAPITYADAKISPAFTLELNVMPQSENKSEEILFQHAKNYGSTSSTIKGSAGFQFVRRTDQKVEFRIFRVVHQKTSDQEVGSKSPIPVPNTMPYFIEVMKVSESATWNYVMGELEEHNMAFHITPGTTNIQVELFADGVSKGKKNIDATEFFKDANVDVFPQGGDWAANESSYLGAGFENVSMPPGTYLPLDAMLSLNAHYKGYLYDLRVWNALVDPSVLSVWHRKDIDASHPNFANLKVNYTMADGAPQIQNHGFQVSKNVHYGDYIRLSHAETNWEMCSFKRGFQGQSSTNVGDMVVGMNTSNHTAYWRVLPGNGGDLKSVKGHVVKSGDAITLYNPYNQRYLSLVGNRNAHGTPWMKEVVGSSTAYTWTIDSNYTADSVANTTMTNLQWGQYLVLANANGKRYLASYKNRFLDGSTDLYQVVGASNRKNYDNVWQVAEVIRAYNYDRMFSKSDHMPSYITLPNFDSAGTLKNTTMPDGTVKN